MQVTIKQLSRTRRKSIETKASFRRATPFSVFVPILGEILLAGLGNFRSFCCGSVQK